jgi:hypothetical protein
MNPSPFLPPHSHPSQRLATRALAAGAIALLSVISTGCVVKEQVVVKQAPAHVQVRYMPAPIAEDRGAQPGPGWSWLPGHWKWEGRDWAWVHGHWVQHTVPVMPAVIVEEITVAPSPMHFWVPGHWVWRLDAGGWIWVKGSWHA